MTKVSVLLPVYNTNPVHLRRTINSILHQTFPDFELLIINDGSTDARVDTVVRSYDDPRIKYHKNEVNEGISNVRNRLLSMASGEYLAIMDHDDIAVKTRFEKQVAFMDAHPDYGICGGACRHFGQLLKRKTVYYPEKDEDIRVGLFFKCTLLHPATMIRAAIIREHGLRYDARFVSANDRLLFIQISDFSKLHNLQDIVHLYRNHTSNTSKTQRAKIEQQQLLLRSHLLERLGAQLNEEELHILNTVLMRGRVRIHDRQTLVELEALLHKLIVANRKSRVYPEAVFERTCAAYFVKRCVNGVFYGRLNVADLVANTRLPVAHHQPWPVRLSRIFKKAT